MAVAMAELTQQNQELTREVTVNVNNMVENEVRTQDVKVLRTMLKGTIPGVLSLEGCIWRERWTK